MSNIDLCALFKCLSCHRYHYHNHVHHHDYTHTHNYTHHRTHSHYPLHLLVHKDKVVSMSEDVGPIIKKLYNRIRQIQTGEGEDKFNWMMEL